MRAVWIAVATMFAVVVDRADAQELPPISAAPGDGSTLPGGTDVSRPLTPVEIPAPPKVLQPNPDPKPEAIERVEQVQQQKAKPRGPLGPSWDDLELLLWWSKAHPIPPIITASHMGGSPVLGSPETFLVVGGRSLGSQAIAGGRFTFGAALNETETVGGELVYFFLGSQTFNTTISGVNPRIQSLGLPYTNSVTGREEAFPLVLPGVSTGSVYATTTTRLQGAEANGVANLFDVVGFKMNGLLGYRFLQVNEGLTIEQRRFASTGTGSIYDEFNGHNQFHGGQLGLHADVSHGVVFCEMTGKVALGQTFEMVRIDGATAIGGFVPGGVYATAANIGRYTRNVFAVVPEGTFKIGVKLNDSGRFYVGYNFLYLSDSVRPGDQIDRTLNPANIPSLNPGGAFIPSDRPRPLMNRTDFWTQGFTIGLETRY
ncbi:MAG: BBP7 family outer membrane beta-barrel protein [Planctomycetes bacterium]|nr:BBP7 family outer membrane beta-barrel protein [Planctomycetota bacterium]